MEKHIYFVRHGESEENLDGVYRGSSAQLTETGKEQAKLLAERIQRIGIDALIASPFARAHDTAVPIAELTGVALESSELLGEWLEPSHLVGLHFENPERKSVRDAIKSATHDDGFRHSDEETFSELAARARAVISVLAEHPAQRICVVTHGGFLRVIIGVLVFGDDFTKKELGYLLDHFGTTNTGVTYAKRKDGASDWRIVTWNDQSHLG